METIRYEMKNILNGINIKWDIAESHNKREGGTAEIIHSETHAENMILKNTKNMSEQGGQFQAIQYTHNCNFWGSGGGQTRIWRNNC